MNRFFCWLFGHVWRGAPTWSLDESEHESILARKRDCLCCDGGVFWVRVDPEEHAGSRYVWSHAHALVMAEKRMARPVWRRR